MESKVGERIRELREMQSYTREGFAEKIGISAKFLYDVETGKKGCSADTMYRISKALSVSVEYLMTGEDLQHVGDEKLICVLEMIDSKKKSQMMEILKILSRMCDSV